MRAVIQRVLNASVHVGNNCISRLERGLLIYLGVSENDSEDDIKYLAEKIINLRIFQDEKGKMNLSLMDISGADCMVISQFTLLGDVRKGRRPSFSTAAGELKAETLYTAFVRYLQKQGFNPSTGQFKKTMQVTYTNDGPVTILLDSKKQF